MKKLLCVLLTAALAAGLALPALAAEAAPVAVTAGEAAAAASADRRLAEVIAKVKATLELDTERYVDFSGSPNEGVLATTWSLYWSGEDCSLSVTAEEDGTILSLRRYDQLAYTPSRSFAPRFPAMTWEQAKAVSDAFLDKLGLTVQYSEEEGSVSLGADSCWFEGELLVNGLPSGHSVSLTVRLSDGAVTRFYRDSFIQKYLGGFPAARPNTSVEDAVCTLASTVDFKLEYVLNDARDRAVLRYLPNDGDSYFVDPADGKLVNLSQLYRQMDESGSMYDTGDGGNAMPAPEASRSGMASSKLTQAELDGAAKLEGVLDKEQLDKAARAIGALGLNKYSLAGVHFSVGDAQEGEPVPVSAQLTYSRQVEQSIWRRYVRLDGRTGALESVSSSFPYQEERESVVKLARAQSAAENFLSAQVPDSFKRTALYDSTEAGDYRASHSFTYCRKENGYFYPAQSLWVEVDISDGSIATYSRSWADEVPFDSADGLISQSEAALAWMQANEVALLYLAVPTYLDPSAPQWRPLVEAGYGYLYEHRLAYAATNRWPGSGVDAKSGQVVTYDYERSRDRLEPYTDLEGHWAKAKVERLAQFGVGYAGGAFQPQKELTQFDLLCLLVSTNGLLYRDGGDVTVDDVYWQAYYMGLITAEERREDAPVTRAELVRMLVNQTGLSAAAQLSGIWATGFADQADIPEDLLGYVAIAKGLDMIHGDGDGNFLPNATAKRVEAAAMLYRFMEQ